MHCGASPTTPGYGLGAAAIGLLAAQTGYPVAFALNGLVILAVAAAGLAGPGEAALTHQDRHNCPAVVVSGTL